MRLISAPPTWCALIRKVMAQFVGTVIGTKMMKTAKVSVTRMFLHPQVLKYVRKRKTYFAHDETEVAKEGDLVLIRETRPLSKHKHFRVVEVLEKAASYTNPTTGETHYHKPLT